MAKQDTVRVAMIGAGNMSNRVHCPSLASFEDVEIAALCDLRTDRLNQTADKYRVERRYTDARKMIEEIAPDAVYAIGQPDEMYNTWLWCLEQKLNLYIEKPMGITAHQAMALAYLAEKNGNITQVSFQRRSCPMVVQLREECLKRGPITHAVCEFYKCKPDPSLGARDHMADNGVHTIDTLRWMCGGEVKEIQALSQRVGVPETNFFAVLLRFDNGATGIMLHNWISGRRIFRVQMHAPRICVEAEHEGKGVLYADDDTRGQWFDTREVASSNEEYVYGGFCAKNREFIDCVKSGKQPGSNFMDAVKTMEVAHKIVAMGLLRGE